MEKNYGILKSSDFFKRAKMKLNMALAVLGISGILLLVSIGLAIPVIMADMETDTIKRHYGTQEEYVASYEYKENRDRFYDYLGKGGATAAATLATLGVAAAIKKSAEKDEDNGYALKNIEDGEYIQA